MVFDDYIKNQINKITYVVKHREALAELEKSLKGEISISTLLHDIDKIIMLMVGIPPSLVSKIHRKISFHHPENIFGIINLEAMVLDWECARKTKIDKQLNAIETAYKYYPEFYSITKHICKKYGLPYKLKDSKYYRRNNYEM